MVPAILGLMVNIAGIWVYFPQSKPNIVDLLVDMEKVVNNFNQFSNSSFVISQPLQRLG